jgi:hypothetical protein
MDNKTTAGLAVAVFLAIVGGTAFHVYGGTKYVVGLVRPDHAVELNKALSIQVANDRAQLPLKIDADTTLVDETATGTQITYTYTLTDAAIAPIRQGEGAMKLAVTKQVCSSAQARTIKGGATLGFVYFNLDKTQKVTEFTVTTCDAA